MNFDKPLYWLKIFRKAFVTNYFRVHYSQFGEDVVLRDLLKDKPPGIYVDVGCYHPKKFSNTYYLKRRGWHGINVDLDEEKIDCFRLARPNDHNVLSAVSSQSGSINVYRQRSFDLGTTVEKSMTEGWDAGSFSIQKIQAATLTEIIENSPFAGSTVDLMSIDVEGHDFAVLQTLNLNLVRPKIIIIETFFDSVEDVLASELYDHFAKHDYQFFNWVRHSLFFRPKP